jgi:hypothetical protein
MEMYSTLFLKLSNKLFNFYLTSIYYSDIIKS